MFVGKLSYCSAADLETRGLGEGRFVCHMVTFCATCLTTSTWKSQVCGNSWRPKYDSSDLGRNGSKMAGSQNLKKVWCVLNGSD